MPEEESKEKEKNIAFDTLSIEEISEILENIPFPDLPTTEESLEIKAQRQNMVNRMKSKATKKIR